MCLFKNEFATHSENLFVNLFQIQLDAGSSQSDIYGKYYAQTKKITFGGTKEITF